MKRKVLIISGIMLCLSVAGTMVYNSVIKEESASEFLRKAGFRNTKDATFGESEGYWRSKYGLHFFDFSSMDAYCKENGFIVGTADRYFGVIPDSVAETMKENYSKIKHELKRYELVPDGSGIVAARFNIDELKGKARRNLPAFNSHNWGIFHKGENRPLSKFIYADALQRRGLSPDNEAFTIRKNYEYEKIYVIGHFSKFNVEGMNIGPDVAKVPVHKNPDPLAVVKTETGWVILAAWE